MKRVAIIGGSLAGIAAAIRLIEDGWHPTLIEVRSHFGGAWPARLPLILNGGAANQLDLFDRIGILDDVSWGQSLAVASPPGTVRKATVWRVPAPFHLAFAGISARWCSLDARLAVARTLLKILRFGEVGRLALARDSMASFLASERQPVEAIERFWEPVVRGACGSPCNMVAASLGVGAVQSVLLAGPWQATLGALFDGIHTAALRRLRAGGSVLRLNTRAVGIAFDGIRVTGVVTEEGIVHASAVIAAIGPGALAPLVSVPMRQADGRLRALELFKPAPRIDVEFSFRIKGDGAALRFGSFSPAILAAPTLRFDRFVRVGRTGVQAIAQAGGALEALDEEGIVAAALEDLHRAVPALRGLEPATTRTHVNTLSRYAATPEVDAARPREAAGVGSGGGIGIANFLLAGDHCQTGLPPGREGAVVSGYEAARAISGMGGPLSQTPPGRFARALGLR